MINHAQEWIQCIVICIYHSLSLTGIIIMLHLMHKIRCVKFMLLCETLDFAIALHNNPCDLSMTSQEFQFMHVKYMYNLCLSFHFCSCQTESELPKVFLISTSCCLHSCTWLIIPYSLRPVLPQCNPTRSGFHLFNNKWPKFNTAHIFVKTQASSILLLSNSELWS